ncbi:MAG: CRISPR-associated endonuclease Cas2 [Tractidigestivibacter sp.]|uniref:CRISPR-associated endonuclease Cas2 n=1 Tax=Tractidigestivibacter sp. TaxID=2847320 RepID=UPI003D8DBC21
MYVLVTYDVASSDIGGSRRLRRVAKTCTQFGQRVQKSVFECKVNPAQYEELKHKLTRIIDEQRDSLRFYNLGDNWHHRVESVGLNVSYDPEEALII